MIRQRSGERDDPAMAGRAVHASALRFPRLISFGRGRRCESWYPSCRSPNIGPCSGGKATPRPDPRGAVRIAVAAAPLAGFFPSQLARARGKNWRRLIDALHRRRFWWAAPCGRIRRAAPLISSKATAENQLRWRSSTYPSCRRLYDLSFGVHEDAGNPDMLDAIIADAPKGQAITQLKKRIGHRMEERIHAVTN